MARHHLLSIGTLVVAVCYAFFNMNNPPGQLLSEHTEHDVHQIAETLASLRRQRQDFREQNPRCSSDRPVIMGWNACLDLIVDTQALLVQLVDTHQISPDAIMKAAAISEHTNDHEHEDEEVTDDGLPSKIGSLEDLLALFFSFFRRGIATERFCVDRALMNQLVSASRASQGHSDLGGNGAIMAVRLAKEKCPVIFSSIVGPETVKALPQGITVAQAGDTSTQAEDDVHLILEYAKGPLFLSGGVPHGVNASALPSSPRANRFIITFEAEPVIPLDLFRASLDLLPSSDTERLKANAPAATVLSGFHLLDGQNTGEKRHKQLSEVGAFLHSLPSQTMRHVELASMGEVQLYKDMKESILSNTDSIGLNEQELAAFYDVYVKNILRNGYPSAPPIGKCISKMLTLIRETGLKRIHLHNIAFQAICQDSRHYSDTQMEHSLVEASLTATEQACAKFVTEADVHLMIPQKFHTSSSLTEEVAFRPSEPVKCFRDGQHRCCVVPVLVCNKPVRLVGLGDHISASGLTPYM